jgi:hypothetical protein
MPLILNGSTGISGIDGSAGTPSYQGTDSNTGIFYPAADTIAFAEGGTEVMRIDSSGNVGIGVTPSAWSAYKALQVGLNASVAGNTSGSVVLLSTNTVFDGSSFKYITTDAATQYQQNTGEHIWRTAASGSAGATLTFTERMRITSAGNIGMGTTTPAHRLDVSGTVAASGDVRAPIFYDSNNTNYYVDPASISIFNDVRVANGNAQIITGNVGQNTYWRALAGSSDFGLSFFDAGNNWRMQLYGTSGAYGFLNSNWGGWDIRKVPSGVMYLNGESTYYISTNEIYYNRLYGVSDVRAGIFYDVNDTTYYLDPNSLVAGIFAGSIGVKNTNPVNTAWGSSSNTGQISIYGATYGVLNIRGDNGGARTFSMGVGDNTFYMCYDNTALAQRVTVNSSGNVVMAGGIFTPIMYDNNNSGYYCDPTSWSYVVNQAFEGYISAVGFGASYRIHLPGGSPDTSNSGIAAAWNLHSDYRLKENVLPVTDGLEKIMKLKVKSFTWKKDLPHIQSSPIRQDGFIAHELQEVLPYAVSGEKDAVDAKGNIKSQSVDYSKVVAPLVQAVQDLKQIIDEQNLRIKQLELNATN